MKKLFIVFLLALSIVLFCACNQTGQYLIFGTFAEVDLSGSGSGDAVDEIEKVLAKVENLMSTAKEGSDVYRINEAEAGESVKVDKMTMEVLLECKTARELSGGTFDPTVYPLVKLWQFAADNYIGEISSLPTEAEIAEALSHVGFDKIILDEENLTVTKTDSLTKIDLGGVAKGYALKKCYQTSSSLKGVINVGGNIAAVGKDLTIGVKNPRGSGYVGTFTLKSGYSVSTSGDYERYYEYNGVRYCHIISPLSGMALSANSGQELCSVSIISNSFALCDALSTAVMLLGKDAGIELIKKTGVGAVLIDLNQKVTAVNLSFSLK